MVIHLQQTICWVTNIVSQGPRITGFFDSQLDDNAVFSLPKDFLKPARSETVLGPSWRHCELKVKFGNYQGGKKKNPRWQVRKLEKGGKLWSTINSYLLVMCYSGSQMCLFSGYCVPEPHLTHTQTMGCLPVMPLSHSSVTQSLFRPCKCQRP